MLFGLLKKKRTGLKRYYVVVLVDYDLTFNVTAYCDYVYAVKSLKHSKRSNAYKYCATSPVEIYTKLDEEKVEAKVQRYMEKQVYLEDAISKVDLIKLLF